jgi:uncharacterized protein
MRLRHHFTFAVTLLSTALWSAAAEAKPVPTSCGAVDLLAQMRSAEPDNHAKIKAAARQVKNGDGLLWKVEKPGIRPSYLFGTMHSTDPRLERHMNRVRPLIARSQSVAVEISELVTPGLKEKAAQDIAMAGVARSGNAIEALHPVQNRSLVEAALLQRGISPERAQRFETWFLIVALSTPACERQRRSMGLISVDEKVGLAGRQAGRQVIGLEKLEDQVAVLRRIGGFNPPIALIETARSQTQIANMRETMTQAYLRDDLGELAALGNVTEILSGQAPNSATRSFTRALLDDRNIVMRDRSMPLLEKGGAFVAVGALHLHGDMGLVQLYREKGYRVTVVK